MGYRRIVLQKGLMSLISMVRVFCLRKFLVTGLIVIAIWSTDSSPAAAQSVPVTPPNQSSEPQLTKSPAGKEEEAARAAARANALRSGAHHFDRVLIIVLENVDYEVASQDRSLVDMVAAGASFTNFHALFHPSYPNYLAMVAAAHDDEAGTGAKIDFTRLGALTAAGGDGQDR